MDAIIELLRKYDSEIKNENSLLNTELEKTKELINSSSNVINNLKSDFSKLYEEKKEMQNVSLIIKLTNDKIKVEKENELLKKKSNTCHQKVMHLFRRQT